VRLISSNLASGKFFVMIWSMYLTPAWMLGSTTLMSPTFSSLPVAGMTCITPMAPTGLFAPWFSCDSGTPGRRA